MTLLNVLTVLAVAQILFLLLLSLLLLTNRSRTAGRRRAQRIATAATAGPLRDWAALGGSIEPLRAALAALPAAAAAEQLLLNATRIPPSMLAELSAAVREERWAEAVLSRARSRLWWRRLEAARLMAIVGAPRDRERLTALLQDPHPAVQAVAAASLPRIADATSVAMVLDALPDHSVFVQLAEHNVLAEVWRLTEPALLERLVPEAPPHRLAAWIAVAEAVGTPDLLERALSLHAHAGAIVRLAVARAARKFYHPTVLSALRALLGDADWRVRAKAAQSLGVVGTVAAVGDLERALKDGNWWVRFRAGLSLAQIGEPGRDVLRRARTQDDRFAAEMATMITGLSGGGIVELSEG